MRQHPLHGEVGLARIGGAEKRFHAGIEHGVFQQQERGYALLASDCNAARPSPRRARRIPLCQAALVGLLSAPASFALLWAAQFFAIGAMMPFLPAILAEGGLSAGQLGAVMAAGSLVRLLAAPLGGLIADRAADIRRVLALGCLLAGATALGFGFAAGLAALLAVQVLHSALAAPVVPLSDALALGAVRAGRFDYARVRSVGSIAFIGGACWPGRRRSCGAARRRLASGRRARPFRAGRARPARRAAAPARSEAQPVGAAARVVVPPHPAGGGRHPGQPRRVLRLLDPALAGGGLGSGFVGFLWGLGVAAEVVLFVYGRSLADRLGLRGLALLAALAGVPALVR
jgi:PPP family 3-phenylpropionic acid transporter